MPTPPPILIRNAGINGSPGHDLLIEKGNIARIGTALRAPSPARVVDAEGGVLLPGLRDHHLHLAALAAARSSLECGPPAVNSGEQLTRQLQHAAAGKGEDDWIRGVGYHESVAGGIDAAWLDARVANCPVRIQHRGGRLWVLNSAALRRLNPAPEAPLERLDGRWTGRLVEGDVWLRGRMQSAESRGFPDLGPVSRELAGHGITHVTDATVHNGRHALEQFRAKEGSGELLQSVTVMGGDELHDIRSSGPAAAVGARKFHLLESDLPDFDVFCDAIVRSHAQGRPVAFHCVTRAELVFALAGLEAAGNRKGDRVEHASVTPPELLSRIRELGLIVAVQPVFVHQRGDQYLKQVAAEDRPWLYRLRAFLLAGIPLLGSSDAPFGNPGPWQAMQAAVTRWTRSGAVLGPDEGVSPEQALTLYISAQSGRPVILRAGEPADLCLLHQPWSEVRTELASAQVRMTFRQGRRIWPCDSPIG